MLHSYFGDGTEGWFSVANILVNLLYQLKDANPDIDEIFLKSDNAVCYHCTNLLSFIQQNNVLFPILIKEYNFSEAQSGKDLFDSKTGTSRLHIYKYANEGHNFVSSADMKTALDSHGGIRGTQVSIISVNQDDDPHAKVKIPGISMLNNFTFGDEAIIARKAYELGEGLMSDSFPYIGPGSRATSCIVSFGHLESEKDFIINNSVTSSTAKLHSKALEFFNSFKKDFGLSKLWAALLYEIIAY
ncbi:unnamed protein product [Mytilus coruscus]|uniref:Uncharacterized protein n=1 Tax=Mytilus coruscus TaxID=42192 RepID=A0A6J8F2N0_MYTCO|nr:unnamed protein product [Mytilus coruscus]